MLRLRRLLAIDGAYTLVVARVARALIALLSAPLIARSIGAEGRGETAAAFAAFYIVPILIALGVPLELRRSLSDGGSWQAVRAARLLTGCAFVPSTAVAVGLFFTLFDGLGAEARWVAAASIVLAPAMIDWMCSENALLALAKFRVVAAMQIAHPLTLLVLVSSLALSGLASVTYIIAANVLACVPSIVVGRISLYRCGIRSGRESATRLLRRSLSYAGASAAEAATNRLDQVLVLPLIGAYQAGLYSVSVTIGVLPLAFGQALGAVYFREMARAPAYERPDVRSRGTREGIALGLMASVTLAALTPAAVPLVFGVAFQEAVPVTIVVLLGSVFCASGYVCSMLLAAQQSGRRMTVAQLASLAATIVVLVVIGPRVGAFGAALASTFGYFMLLLMTVCMLGVRPSAVLPRATDFQGAIFRLLGGVGGKA